MLFFGKIGRRVGVDSPRAERVGAASQVGSAEAVAVRELLI